MRRGEHAGERGSCEIKKVSADEFHRGLPISPAQRPTRFGGMNPD
jgi:hypothetical protein